MILNRKQNFNFQKSIFLIIPEESGISQYWRYAANGCTRLILNKKSDFDLARDSHFFYLKCTLERILNSTKIFPIFRSSPSDRNLILSIIELENCLEQLATRGKPSNKLPRGGLLSRLCVCVMRHAELWSDLIAFESCTGMHQSINVGVYTVLLLLRCIVCCL